MAEQRQRPRAGGTALPTVSPGQGIVSFQKHPSWPASQPGGHGDKSQDQDKALRKQLNLFRYSVMIYEVPGSGETEKNQTGACLGRAHRLEWWRGEA